MIKRLVVLLPALALTTLSFAAEGHGPERIVAQSKKPKKPAPPPPSSSEPAPAPSDEAPWGQTAQEKKAVKESIAKVNEALAKARKECGNPGLAVKIDWANYGKFEDALVKESGRTKANVYGLVGELVGGVFTDLASVCSDVDYKKGASTLKVVHAKPSYTQGISSSKAQVFTRNGGELSVVFDAQVTGGGTDMLRAVL